jgi:solute carrier family 35 (UDP-galactose transporter), member B1
VLILGVLIARKSYSIQKYFFVLMMVIGVGVFSFDDQKKSSNDDTWIGYVIVGISVLMDGMVGAAQEKIRSHSKPSAMNFMFHVNAWSSLLLIALMAWTGGGRDLRDFVMKYPELMWKLPSAIFFATIGQIFISSMVTSYGS